MCLTQAESESKRPDIGAGGLVAGVTTFATNLASWAIPVAAETKDEVEANPQPEPELALEPEIDASW